MTLPLFLVSLYGLYYTPVFDWAMGGFWGRTLMLVHFVVVGLLLFWPILSIDPSPHAWSTTPGWPGWAPTSSSGQRRSRVMRGHVSSRSGHSGG